MGAEPDAAVLEELVARQRITDSVTRYIRGVDRIAFDLIRSAFGLTHNSHGPAGGTVEDFHSRMDALVSVSRNESSHRVECIDRI